MLLAFILFNVVHPGRIMKGKESDIPSRKSTKSTGRVSKIGYQESLPMAAGHSVAVNEEAALSES